MTSSAFPGIPTGDMQILLNVIPIEDFCSLRQSECHKGLPLINSGMPTLLNLLEKRKLNFMFGMSLEAFSSAAKYRLTEYIKKEILKRNFECQIMDRKILEKNFECQNVIRFKTILNQNTIRIYMIIRLETA